MTLAHPLSKERYAARLLFQYRFESDTPGGFRTVEDRIILLFEVSAEEAYAAANRRGEVAARQFVNDSGANVYFEFVGVTDLLNLGPEAEDDEVWYDVRRMKDPMQRRRSLVPKMQDLNAVKLELANRRGSTG